MEKFIELLNEYHHFNSDLIYYGWDEEYERVYFHTELPEEQKKKLAKAGIDDEGIDEERVYDEWLCSKKFGFIKWLVENDKINLGQKLFNLTKNDNRKSIICDLDNNDFSWEDTFLMLLSISDTPIEDLVSYLK